MHRLFNKAFGYNSADDAKEALKLLLADELKAERKKATDAANLTDEAKAILADKKAAALAKRRVTTARKRAEKAAAKQNQLQPAEPTTLRNAGDAIAGTNIFYSNIFIYSSVDAC